MHAPCQVVGGHLFKRTSLETAVKGGDLLLRHFWLRIEITHEVLIGAIQWLEMFRPNEFAGKWLQYHEREGWEPLSPLLQMLSFRPHSSY